ncbi:MAG: hypothetical protein WA869_13525 [Alloacidobacterium sp.]|jgi:hypothetical protein
MKKIVCVLAIVGSLSATASHGQNYHRSCSSETVRGDYAFRVSGEIFTAAGLVYRDGIALTHFDGDGALTQVDYVLANGVPVPGPKDPNGFNTDETGTYSVNENCTGAAEIDFPTPPGGTSGAKIKLFFVISDDGRQLNTIVTSLTPPNSTTAVSVNIHSDAIRVHDER